jgi:hypothetical protein
VVKGAEFNAFLSELREIGWREWDPIGIVSYRAHCEDEYDTYLLAAAEKLTSGASEQSVADYLVEIEIGRMGFTLAEGMRCRAMIIAGQISAIVQRK